jgi:hypothetical protein
MLVPVEPTEEQYRAYRRALREFINALPAEERDVFKRSPRGKIIADRDKMKARYQAMVAAAPSPPVA